MVPEISQLGSMENTSYTRIKQFCKELQLKYFIKKDVRFDTEWLEVEYLYIESSDIEGSENCETKWRSNSFYSKRI